MHAIAALIVTLLCVVSSVNAHMFLSSVYINGNKQNCIRPHPSNQWDYPISDKVSRRFSNTKDMICGWPPALDQRAPSRCTIPAGTKIQMQWWHAFEGDDVVDSSHKGPCAVYMARSDTGSGAVWFKIFEEGFNYDANQWCTDRVRQDGPNKGRVDVTIPSTLAPGNYLVRGDFWALHEGYLEFGAQPYVGCMEITVTGNGNVQPSSGLVNMENYFQPNQPGLFFNIYNEPNIRPRNYPIPGPSVAVFTGGSSTIAPTPPSNSSGGCDIGSVGCACSDAGYCDRNLKCVDSIHMCLPLECPTGGERCICTQGGSCDDGLMCMSNLCVKNTCQAGAEKCSCNSSGKCNSGLSCYSNLCVKVDGSVPNPSGNSGNNDNINSSSSISLSLFAFAVLALIALL